MQAIKAITYLLSNCPGKYYLHIDNNIIKVYENKSWGRSILIDRIELDSLSNYINYR